MKRKEKILAEKKADIAICKLLDIYYLNPTASISSRLNDAIDKIRELQTAIENTSN